MRFVYKVFIKNIFDFFISLFLIIIFSPIIIILILLLQFENNGNPFFLQKRPGKNSQIFTLLKFRTMNQAKNIKGKLLPPSQRITKIGKILRSTSLDELPQLINVLKGDMSLIGPRPLRVEYLPFYSPYQARRHEVKPGITGWSQINGRNCINWNERLKMDVWYVDNLSFFLDLRIFSKTLITVVKREGVNQDFNVTMEPFKGVELDG